MDTNLYDFLRTIQAYVAHPSKGHEFDPRHQIRITKAEFDWLTAFLRNPGTVIEFRARPTGRMLRIPGAQPPPTVFSEDLAPDYADVPAETEEPEMEHHYALAGTAQEVFELLLEAMLLNPTFASVVVAVGRTYTAKVRVCRRCGQRHNGRTAEDCPNIEAPSWEFKQREP